MPAGLQTLREAALAGRHAVPLRLDEGRRRGIASSAPSSPSCRPARSRARRASCSIGSYNGQTIQIWVGADRWHRSWPACWSSSSVSSSGWCCAVMGARPHEQLARGLVCCRLLAALLHWSLPLVIPTACDACCWLMAVRLSPRRCRSPRIFRLAARLPGSTACSPCSARVALISARSATFALAASGYWLLLVSAWLFAWLFAERLSNDAGGGRDNDLGAACSSRSCSARRMLVVWEVSGARRQVPQVILPAPSMIWTRIVGNTGDALGRLRADLPQGGAVGLRRWAASPASLIAILVDRSPFLKRGLLPIGNFVSALPLVGIAPIMVMWFGFDWPSKAAVVVLMTFFPMLVNTVAGLNVTGAHGARPDAHLRRQLLADAVEAAATGRGALHLQCAQDQLDSRPDWRNRGGILRDTHCGNGLPDIRRKSAA